MATMELAAGSGGGQVLEANGGGGSSDTFVVHPHLYPCIPLKSSPKTNFKKALGKLASKGEEKQASAYIDALIEARHALCSALESPSVSDESVSSAVSTYTCLLVGLVGSSGGGSKPAGGAAAATSPDEALSAAEHGSSAGSLLSAPASKLRHAVSFEWSEVVLAPRAGSLPTKAVHSDAVFELASVLVAAAWRLMHAAAQACQDSASGVATPATTRAYKLLREAAGMLECVAREVLPSLPPGVSADIEPQVVRALATTALADAQQLTVLRAVAKGNQPALICSLAADTAALYEQAASQVACAVGPGAASCKLQQYGQYKAASFSAYAHCFNSIALWKQQDNCGGGLKSLEAAAAQLQAAKKAAAGFDATPPSTLNLAHRRVDEDLERILADTQRRMKRENDAVFLQRIAADVPLLPDKKRLVSSLPYMLPPPAALVKEGVADRCFTATAAPQAATTPPAPVVMHSGGSSSAAAAGAATAAPGGKPSTADGGVEEQGCSCCRWIVFLIAAPILAALWLVGAVIWLVLLPLKCCCPCCGFPLQWAADLVLWLMRLPARGLMWASGKPWEPRDAKK